MRNVGPRGKQKLADRWESQPYVVCRQPNEDIPVYEVRPDNARSRKTRTLHRNLLLPFKSILDWHSYEEEESQVVAVETMDKSDLHSTVSDAEILSDADESSMESDSSGTLGVLPRSKDLPTLDIQSPRPQRTKRKPTWMNSTDWVLKK